MASCLLLTSDATLSEAMRASLNATSVELELRTDAASANSQLAVTSIAWSLTATMSLVPGMSWRRYAAVQSNKLSVVFVVVNAITTVNTAFKAGANFVLAKPVQDTVAFST
jgi:FixJ family two-component response regulator